MDVIFETALYRLTVGEDCIAKSLILKETGTECLSAGEEMALFSATQERPYNNEIKLANPNKRTTYQGCRLERNGNMLKAAFETIPCRALVEVTEKENYLVFTLAGYEYDENSYAGLSMNLPPITELRLLQLPVREMKSFGYWLNVAAGDEAAVNVLAANGETCVDSEKRKSCRVLYAEALKDIKLIGASAALIVSRPEKLMDVIGELEEDYKLPRGVASRRSDSINASIFWTAEICPENADELIAYAKKSGFRLMLIYYSAIFEGGKNYSRWNSFEYNKSYPNGREDLRLVLRKITEAGILPGFHVLHTHIGTETKYVTPVCDSRLHHTKRFTLSKALGPEDTTVFVNENPDGCAMHDGCRMLQLGGEVISYEDYTRERPYAFTGCRRGAYRTAAYAHPAGTIGGILDVSEFGAGSIYLDQNTDLQDEIADKIADVYAEGFRFMYFDGSEGTNAPFGYHIPMAQYRVYQKLRPEPLFTEGAAKAHFSWHMLSGGNAFDVFPAAVFKEKIDEFPAEEAPRMRRDHTRVNFGWWAYRAPDFQCDMYEYGTSHAAGFDCPVTIQFDKEELEAHPRTDDLLEVLRRWEDVRARHWLTEEQKEALRENGAEYTLILNERGEYELLRQFPLALKDSLRAFTFRKDGKSVISFWHPSGSGEVSLPVSGEGLILRHEFNEPAQVIERKADHILLKTGGRMYLTAETAGQAERLKAAFEKLG